ncbi:MAG: DUF2752 domain-containing protein [Phycisphaerales bacterium]|nr:DUF2752 domain-containing protein [Phycisphaerales bacterium]
MESLTPTAHPATPARSLAHPVDPCVWSVAAHPLGPIVILVPMENGPRARGAAFVVLTACVVVLAVAARLTPDPAGFGTHRQLGSTPCLMPVLTGYPCPTCGMTTAFAYAVRGRLGAAFHAQPAGLLIALSVALAGVASAGIVATGRTWRVNWYRVPPVRLAVIVLAVVLAGWAYKIVTFSSFSAVSGD